VSTACKSQENNNLKLRALLLHLLLLLISDHPSQDFPRGALGYDVDELHASPQPLVVTLGLFDVLEDLAPDEGVALFDGSGRSDDECFGDFAFSVRWDADDDAVVDGRMREDVGFEFGGRDLHAFDFDKSVESVSKMSWQCQFLVDALTP
jgi:hypothetical protein